MNASKPLNDVNTSQMVNLFFEDLKDKVHFHNAHKLLLLSQKFSVYYLDIFYKTMSVNFRARQTLAGKTRTWHTEHSRRLRGCGKIIATRKMKFQTFACA